MGVRRSGIVMAGLISASLLPFFGLPRWVGAELERRPPAIGEGGPSAVLAQHAPPCTVSATRTLSSLNLLPTEVVSVSINAEVVCDVSARPSDIALVIDASAGISNDSLQRLKQALIRSVAGIDLSRGAGIRIAVVPYDDRGVQEASLSLSGDIVTVANNLRRVSAGTRVCTSSQSNCGAASGMRAAADILRVAAEARPGAARSVILATAGLRKRPNDPDFDHVAACTALEREASNLKEDSSDILLATACASEGGTESCEDLCLNGLASSRDYTMHAAINIWTPLEFGLPDLATGTGEFHPAELIEVYDHLPTTLAYAGGGSPKEIAGQRLTWEAKPKLPTWTFSDTYRAQVVGCGNFPSSEDATLALRYALPLWGGDRLVKLPRPMLIVPCDTPTPSPTATGPSPTPSATPTDSGVTPTPSVGSPSPSPSSSPTQAGGSPTPTGAKVFLPLLLKTSCSSSARRDLLILIDASGGMRRPAGSPFGQDSRWVAAQRSALAFLDALEPARDRVGLIQYGAQPRLLGGGLQPCCDAAREILASGTGQENAAYAWAALALAGEILTGVDPPLIDGERDIVLISDEVSADLSLADQQLVLDTAAGLRRANIRIATLGIGLDDAGQGTLLGRIADHSGRALASRRLSGPDPEPELTDWLRCLP